MIPPKMKALVVTGEKTIEVQEFSVPQPAPGEILIRLEHCLICTWEQRIFQNGDGMKMPFLPGHEASGVVAWVLEGTPTSFREGDPVVVKTLDSCGHCEFCYRGLDNQCVGTPKKRFYDGVPGSGGMAQYIALPVSRVFPLPDPNCDLREAAFAEPVACCLRSLEQADLQFGEDVVIVGGGIMGQLHNVLAKKRGTRTILVEMDPARAALATRMGADEIVDPSACDPILRIKELTCGRGANVVFITAPIPQLAELYLDALDKVGRIVYYTSFSPDTPISISPKSLYYSEKKIMGSYSPTSQGFYTAARLLGRRIIDVRPFLTETYPMSEAYTAFTRSMSAETLRVGIDLWK